MTAKEVFTIPGTENLDGLTLSTKRYPYVFKHRIDDIRLKEGDDILLATYPRTGTTWLGQIVSLMLTNDKNYEDVKKTPLHQRFPYLEYTADGSDYAEVEKLDTIPAPRADKTHLPYRLIQRWLHEDRVKTIVTTRNPKDTLVSLFHFYQNMKGFEFSGSWNDFFEHVKAGKQIYGDQFEWLQDWDNNKHKVRDQLLFIKFEDLKRDFGGEIKRIAAFLGIQTTESRLMKIAEDTGLQKMKSDAATNSSHPDVKPGGQFVRGGYIGEWKRYFTVEQNEWFDAKYKKRYQGLDIDVDYE